MAFKVKALLILILITVSFAEAQKTDVRLSDTLESKRTFFITEVYLNGGLIKNSKSKQLYNNLGVKESKQLLNKSNILLLSSPVLVGGGIYLVYDAIKGTPMLAYIDGVAYPYSVRPIKNVIAGLGIFAIGICLFEYSHEFKAKSVELYNNKLKGSKRAQNIKLDFGIIEDNRLGIRAKF